MRGHLSREVWRRNRAYLALGRASHVWRLSARCDDDVQVLAEAEQNSAQNRRKEGKDGPSTLGGYLVRRSRLWWAIPRASSCNHDDQEARR